MERPGTKRRRTKKNNEQRERLGTRGPQGVRRPERPGVHPSDGKGPKSQGPARKEEGVRTGEAEQPPIDPAIASVPCQSAKERTYTGPHAACCTDQTQMQTAQLGDKRAKQETLRDGGDGAHEMHDVCTDETLRQGYDLPDTAVPRSKTMRIGS